MAINTEYAIVDALETVNDTVKSLADFADITQAQVNRASILRLSVNSGEVYYRYTGTDPDTSTGHPLATGATEIILGQQNIRQFKLVRKGGTNATVFVTLEE